jgi:hypothetical protein
MNSQALLAIIGLFMALSGFAIVSIGLIIIKRNDNEICKKYKKDQR